MLIISILSISRSRGCLPATATISLSSGICNLCIIFFDVSHVRGSDGHIIKAWQSACLQERASSSSSSSSSLWSCVVTLTPPNFLREFGRVAGGAFRARRRVLRTRVDHTKTCCARTQIVVFHPPTPLQPKSTGYVLTPTYLLLAR